MRLVILAAAFSLLGYGGMQSAHSVQLPPARVVDAVADTSTLAVGTAAYLQSEFEPIDVDPEVTNHTLNRSTSTSVPPTPTTTTPSPTVTTPPSTEITTPPAAVTSSPDTTTTTSAPTTSSTVVATTPPPPSARERGEIALERYSYDWRTGLPGWEISFHPGRKGVLGYTFVQEKRIEVYVRDDMPNALLAHVIAHEIGHAIDVSKNTGDDRRRWQQLRGIEDRPWWPGNGATDFSTGAGDFAEAFAAWQVGGASFRSNLAGAPDAAAIALMAELSAN